jgi:TetR/AcrR family transcriptional regulator, mexJK operon transcriptional repressor
MQNALESTLAKTNAVRRVPRGEKRREEIAAVAERMFLECGFAATTMQMIAARAGASKETLYRHFGSKDGLISEIVRNRSAQIIGGDDGELSIEGAPRETLLGVGRNLLRILVGPDSLAFLRGVVSEAPRAPGLGEIFYSQGPARTLSKLARYLGAATLRGELCCSDPELAAKLFLGAVVANRVVLELVAPGRDPFGEEKRQAHVEEAVALFLARYGRDVSPKA